MLNEQRFGLEIEMSGISREKCAKLIAKALGSEAIHIGGTYDEWNVADANGKRWKVVFDGSIRAEYWSLANNRYQSYADRHAGKDKKVELVAPICDWADFEVLEKILKMLGKSRAKVNQSCGIHVHVDGKNHSVKSIKNMIGMWMNKEELLYAGVGVLNNRAIGMAKKCYVDHCWGGSSGMKKFYDRMMNESFADLDAVGEAYYQAHGRTLLERRQHYSESRYYGLNLHALWNKGTVEFRLFNSSLDFSVVRAYIILAMALNEKALEGKGMSLKAGAAKIAKENMVWWLERLGLRGKEWADVRKVLVGSLPALAQVV